MAFDSAANRLMVPNTDMGQSFNAGAQAANQSMAMESDQLDAKRRRSMEDMQQLGSIGMALMGGKLDGEVDQQRLAQLIPWAQAHGIDVSVLQGRPDLIPVITRASLTSLQQIQSAQSAQEIDLRTQQLQQQIAAAAKGEAYTLGPGQNRFDGNNNLIAQGPASAASQDPPTIQSRFNEQSGREEKVQWDPAVGDWVPFGGQKTANSDDPTLNMNQSAAALYADRMVEADKILSQPNLGPAQMDWMKPLQAQVPVLGNAMVGGEYQQVEQAKRNFINAVLRRESGAIISPAEFENANKQYFPQPFDGQEVIDQKAANRATAIAGLQRAAGPAYHSRDTAAPSVSGAPDDMDPATMSDEDLMTLLGAD